MIKKEKTKKRRITKTPEREQLTTLAAEIIAIAEDAVISVGSDQRILYFNRGAEKIFGYRSDEITGKPLDMLIPARYADIHKKHIDGFSRSSESAKYMNERARIYGLRKDGTEFPAEGSISKLELNGEAVFSVILRDVTDREHSKASLEEALSLLRATLDATADGMLVVDTDGRITSFNRQFLEMWRIPENAAESRDDSKLLAFVHDQLKDPDGFYRKVRELYAEPEAESWDIIEFKDGRVFERYSKPQRIGDTVAGRVWSFRDVTASRRAVEALRRSEERYRILFDQSPVGVYIFDRDLKVTQCNKRMVEILQSTYENVIGYSIRELKDQTFVPVTEQTLEGLYSYQEGMYETTTSGAKIWLSQYFSPLYDEKGRVIGGIGVAEDITERKQAEEALKENERMLSTLLGNLPGCSYRYRKNGSWMLDFISEGIFALSGYTPDEFLSETKLRYFDIVHPDDRQRVWDEINSALGIRERYDLVYRITTKEGDLKWVWDKGQGIYSQDGSLPYVEGFVTDITESKRLEEQLRRAQKMEAIGNLAGGVAHDFNNLLTIISSYSDLALDNENLNDGLRVSILEIKRAGERAAALTGQLLALGRRQVFRLEVLDLNNLISDLGKMFERLLPANIDITTDFHPGLWRVKADRGQIEQAIMNLLLNARDAMSQGGSLKLKTTNVRLDEIDAFERGVFSPGEYVVIEVSDTGRGMDESTKARIFEPFFTTKDNGRGTGLGLATTFGIISQSKGHITVSSDVGMGTTFRVYLPRTFSPAEPARKDESRPDRPKGGTETVLLIEDESTVRSILSMVLRGNGYNVIAARDCSEALRIGSSYADPLHMVVTDVAMPDMNGTELVKRLTQTHPDVKVLYISGYTMESIFQSGEIERGFGYLGKPFTPGTLLRKVREVLDAL